MSLEVWMTQIWNQVSPSWLQDSGGRRLAQVSHKKRERREKMAVEAGPRESPGRGSCQVKGSHSKYPVSAGEVSVRMQGTCGGQRERGPTTSLRESLRHSQHLSLRESLPCTSQECQCCPSSDLPSSQLWRNQQEAAKEQQNILEGEPSPVLFPLQEPTTGLSWEGSSMEWDVRWKF